MPIPTPPDPIGAEIRAALDGLACLARDDTLRAVAAAGALVVERLRAGGKVLVFGNGGSAAAAQHFAAELVGRFRRVRPALAVVALTADTAVVSALANDGGFEQVFARQIEALGRAGDIALAISTSGASRNVVAAAERARELGLTVVALTGRDGGALASLADCAVIVPLDDTPRIQEAHLITCHALCAAIELAAPGSEPVQVARDA